MIILLHVCDIDLTLNNMFIYIYIYIIDDQMTNLHHSVDSILITEVNTSQ